jgi:ABC-type phosphate transport system substrate-binding protein
MTSTSRGKVTMQSRAKRATVVLLMAGIAVALCFFPLTSTARAAGRTLSVAPATELGNQVVLVHWTGFDPTWGVIVQQCKASPVSLADCETALPFPNSENGNEVIDAVTQSDGSGQAFIEARPAAQLPSLDCSAESPCSLIAYENDGQIVPPNGLPPTAVTAPITFARSAADCPPVTSFDVRAEGEASSSQALYRWIAGLCTANPKLVVDYTETSSVAGRADFLAKDVDVGVTSTAATDAELAGAHPSFTYAPIDLTAVVVAYNLTDTVTGRRITDLTLSARLLTRLITDTELLDFFNDPELNRLNPGHSWPWNGMTVPLIRAERNADTLLATSWMASDANAMRFLADDDPDGVHVQPDFKDYHYPTDVFEAVDGNTAYVPRQGETEVGRRLFYGVTPTGGSAVSTSDYGFMGLVDLPTAARYNLPVAKLVNASGTGVAPDTASILAGYGAMKTDPNGITKSPDFASTNPAAYPLVKVDYAMVPTSVDASRAGSLKRFLGYAAGAGQTTLPNGFVPMPADLVAQTNAGAAAITVAGAPSPPPPTTVPTTTPTATPPIDLGTTSSGDLGTEPSGDASTPPASTPPVQKPVKRVAKPTALARAKPVVNVADAAERFGLPIVVGLALLAGLYPLTRRSAQLVGRGFGSIRRRLSRAPARSVEARSVETRSVEAPS